MEIRIWIFKKDNSPTINKQATKDKNECVAVGTQGVMMPWAGIFNVAIATGNLSVLSTRYSHK